MYSSTVKRSKVIRNKLLTNFTVRPGEYNLRKTIGLLVIPEPAPWKKIETRIDEMLRAFFKARLFQKENQTLLGILKRNLTNYTAIVGRAPTRQSCKTVLF